MIPPADGEAAVTDDAVTHDAITEEEAIGLLAAVRLDDAACIAVAVSGGPDSMALLHISDLWARRFGRRLLVLTVDHGLRAESPDEAAMVAEMARRLGHEHRTLVWHGEKPTSGLQAAARRARQTLLTQACLDADTRSLLMAHHRDDQVETVLHRVERDTGPDGLAGMAAEAWWGGVRILRPLLAVAKIRLVATCGAAGMPWISDPSNDDPRFTRARFRRMRPVLDEVGLTADRLERLAVAMGAARRAMDAAAAGWLAEYARMQPCGTQRLDRGALAAQPEAFRLSVLKTVLGDTGGGGYPPGTEALAGLDAWIARAQPGQRRTLAGCLIEMAAEALVVMRESVACAPARAIAGGRAACWDGRFLVRNPTAHPVRIGPCGENGWRRLRLRGLDAWTREAARKVPHAARLAWPLVTDLDGVVVLPHLVLGERGAPEQAISGVNAHLLAPRQRRIYGPLANGRLTT